mmetsp:Transcript_27863/g.71741  ORF Transcript_27863/g.71741 Transcript_27863/m.71741 type:complete len:260 (+) Transcript_27863:43-822(+)
MGTRDRGAWLQPLRGRRVQQMLLKEAVCRRHHLGCLGVASALLHIHLKHTPVAAVVPSALLHRQHERVYGAARVVLPIDNQQRPRCDAWETVDGVVLVQDPREQPMPHPLNHFRVNLRLPQVSRRSIEYGLNARHTRLELAVLQSPPEAMHANQCGGGGNARLHSCGEPGDHAAQADASEADARCVHVWPSNQVVHHVGDIPNVVQQKGVLPRAAPRVHQRRVVRLARASGAVVSAVHPHRDEAQVREVLEVVGDILFA